MILKQINIILFISLLVIETTLLLITTLKLKKMKDKNKK